MNTEFVTHLVAFVTFGLAAFVLGFLLGHWS